MQKLHGDNFFEGVVQSSGRIPDLFHENPGNVCFASALDVSVEADDLEEGHRVGRAVALKTRVGVGPRIAKSKWDARCCSRNHN